MYIYTITRGSKQKFSLNKIQNYKRINLLNKE